jgi:hypothetical protein
MVRILLGLNVAWLPGATSVICIETFKPSEINIFRKTMGDRTLINNLADYESRQGQQSLLWFMKSSENLGLEVELWISPGFWNKCRHSLHGVSSLRFQGRGQFIRLSTLMNSKYNMEWSAVHSFWTLQKWKRFHGAMNHARDNGIWGFLLFSSSSGSTVLYGPWPAWWSYHRYSNQVLSSTMPLLSMSLHLLKH